VAAWYTSHIHKKTHGEVILLPRALSLAERVGSFRLTITVYRCGFSLFSIIEPIKSLDLCSIFVS